MKKNSKIPKFPNILKKSSKITKIFRKISRDLNLCHFFSSYLALVKNDPYDSDLRVFRHSTQNPSYLCQKDFAHIKKILNRSLQKPPVHTHQFNLFVRWVNKEIWQYSWTFLINSPCICYILLDIFFTSKIIFPSKTP